MYGVFLEEIYRSIVIEVTTKVKKIISL